jgi:Zn-dependent protease
MLSWLDLSWIIQLSIIFIISISFHEYAHAWASFQLWDPTAKNLGRLTPNPLKHIDPIGFLLIFFIGFGRGRPVPIDSRYYKHPLRDELLVALAGPMSNIILAVLAMIVSLIYTYTIGLDVSLRSGDIVVQFWYLFAMTNIALAVFNMIPVPPLDGYRVLTYLYPPAQTFIMRYFYYLSFGFLILIVVVPFSSQLIKSFIFGTAQIIYGILYRIVSIPFVFL